MGGVPSGRGCDACRKQKKKCDLTDPACSRCTRLRIPCVGRGKKRYIFKQENPAALQPACAQLNPRSSPAPAPTDKYITSIPPWVPGNESTQETGAFVAVLDISDLRYDLSGFGGFLKDIPQRMGRNKALDASANALTASFPVIYTRQVSSKMLTAYVHALKCLRITLQRRETAQTPDTLCAIYLITLCQSWIGSPNDNTVRPSEAVLHILNCIASNGWQGRFENQLFLTLSISILSESIYNPNITLGPWFRKVVDNFAPHKNMSQRNGGPGPALSILTLVRLVELVRNPRGDITDIQIGYQAMLRETAQARENLERMFGASGTNQTGEQNGGLVRSRERVQLLCQAQYAVLLATSILVNSLLSAFTPSNTGLAEQVSGFPDELVGLSRATLKYRPVGAGFIPPCLLMGCVATTDVSQLTKMTNALVEYETDPMQTQWESWAGKARNRFQDLRFKTSQIYLENNQA